MRTCGTKEALPSAESRRVRPYCQVDCRYYGIDTDKGAHAGVARPGLSLCFSLSLDCPESVDSRLRATRVTNNES